MTQYTLERKLAAPVRCLHCGWIGQVKELRNRGTDMAGNWHCPRCDGLGVEWIEHEAPMTTQ